MSMTEDDIAIRRDESLVNSILSDIGSSNLKAYRFKTVMRMNPYMANNPQAVAAMANMPISTRELMSQAGAIYGMQTSEKLATDLTRYSPSVQRSIYAGLRPEQQQTLKQMGYTLPERTVEEGGWFNTLLDVGLFVPKKVMGGLGQIATPVVSPMLEGLTTVSDLFLGKPYRTIRQLDDTSQWLSLLAGIGVTAGSLLLMPATAGASSSLLAAYWGGNVARLGLAAQAGMAAATATSFVSSSIQNGGTGVWTNAWSNAWNGEKLFRNSAVTEATEKLVDPTLIALAQDFADQADYPGQLIDIAKMIAGQRDSTNQNLQFKKLEEIATKYVAKDSPLYESVYKSLTALLNEPVFQEAVGILERGKISMGRDVAAFLGLDPLSGAGRWVSGGIDATSLLVFDPFNQVAGGLRAIAQVRRGLQAVDGVTGAQRFADVLSHKSMARKMDVVVEATNRADGAVLRQGAQEWRPILPELVNHKKKLGRDLNTQDVIEFVTGEQQFNTIMNGIGIVKGSNYHQVKHLSRTEQLFRQAFVPMREVLAGVADVRAEVKNFPKLVKQLSSKDPEAARLFVERLFDADTEVVRRLTSEYGMDETAARMVATTMAHPELQKVFQGVDDIYENARLMFNASDADIASAKQFFAQAEESVTEAYKIGRLIGRMPGGLGLRPLASFIEGVSTELPRGAVHIVGRDAPDDIRKYVELFRTVGVPSYVRNQWINTITMAPNGAARLMAANSMLDSFATAFGMRFTEAGQKLLDEFLDRTRQLYGYGSVATRNADVVRGLTDSFPVGVRPVRDMADMFAIPDLQQVRDATRMGLIMRATLGVSENTVVQSLQNRFWKPAVLLRMGFFLRNASEEMLSLMVRYGSGRWGQETAARMLGERVVYREAREVAAAYSHSALTPRQQWMLEQSTHVPGPLRGASRLLDRMPDSWPMWNSLDRLRNWMFRSFDSILGESFNVVRLPGRQFILETPAEGVTGLEGILVNGLLGDQSSIRKALRNITVPETDTYRNRAIFNLQTMWRRLAFGDMYSLRRMMLGGIDDRLLADAMNVIANNDNHFRAVMSHVGTSKLATWAQYGSDDISKQLVIGENGSAGYDLVHVGSTRRLAQQGEQAVGEQPWNEAFLNHIERWTEDPFGKGALAQLVRYFGQDASQIIDRELYLDILATFGNAVFDQKVYIDKDLWHLYLHTAGNSRVFRREMFDSYLAQMIKSDEAIETLAATNPKLAQWAANRNKLVENIQTRFPGNSMPTWNEISEVLTEDARLLVELDKKFVTRQGYFVEDIPEEGLADQVTPNYKEIVDDNILRDEIDVTGAPILESFGFKVGYSKIKSQIDLLNRISELRSTLNPQAQEMVNRSLATWMARPDTFDLELINGRGLEGLASPFIENMDDLERAIRVSWAEVAEDPDLQKAFNKNPDFISPPQTIPVYGVSYENVSFDIDLTSPTPPALVDDVSRTIVANVLRRTADTEMPLTNSDGLFEAVRNSIWTGKPIALDDANLAELITNASNEAFDALARAGVPGFVGGRSLALQSQSTDPVWDLVNLSSSDSGPRVLANIPDEYPMLWDPFMGAPSASGKEIEDRAVAAFMADIRAGRRTQLVYKQQGGQLYRNQLGEAIPLQDGEIIQSSTPLYTSPKMRTKDQVFPGQHLRYFKMETPAYQGQAEFVWPVLDAVLFDEARKAAGSRAYQLNNPKMLPPTKSRQAERVSLNRRELHYAGQDHVRLTPQGDLPDWQIVQVYELRPQKLFDQVVQFGFGAIGKMIDTVSREPMAFHSLLQSIERNRNMTRWLIDNSANEAALSDVLVRLSQATSPTSVSPRFFENWTKMGRAAGEIMGATSPSRWSDVQAMAFIRGMDEDEFELFLRAFKDRSSDSARLARLNISEKEVDALITFVRSTRDKFQATLLVDTTDELIGHIDRLFGEGSAWLGRPSNSIDLLDDQARAFLDAMTNDDWVAIKNSASQRLKINEQNMSNAAEQAVRDIMPFVDSHEVRSQFAETARGFLPFWYAEENFLKRWARILSEGGPAMTLARIRRLQLQYMGLRSAGVIRTDTQGKDYFVWPGSALFVEAIDKLIPGNERIPVETFLQTPTSNLVPGFNESFGTPAVGPLAAIPLSIAAALNPEVMPLKRTIVGDANVFRTLTENLFPTHWKRLAEAINLYVDGTSPESGNARVASATMTAIANLEAIGGIPDDMTPDQQDEVLRTVREHTRIILLAQAIAGVIGPGTTSLLETPEGSTLSWITDGQIENPADLFSSNYYTLISNLGIEEGTFAYLESYQNSTFRDVIKPENVLAYTVSKTTTPSGAPLPSTELAWEFYETNTDYFNQYPEAAPWLMPQDESGDERSSYAYNQELIAQLRVQRTPEEFMRTIKYKEGAQWYFARQEAFENEIRRLRQRGQSQRADALRNLWESEAQSFKLTHPVFAEMLVSGEARERRQRIITQMRYLLDDPAFPQTPHFGAMKELQDAFDAFMVVRGELSQKRTMYNQSRLSALKLQFASAIEQFIIDNPAVRPYWQTVLQPEAGLN